MDNSNCLILNDNLKYIEDFHSFSLYLFWPLFSFLVLGFFKLSN